MFRSHVHYARPAANPSTAKPTPARYTPDGISQEEEARAKRVADRAPHPHRGIPLAFVRSALFSVSGVGTLSEKPLHLPLGPMPSPPASMAANEGAFQMSYFGPRLGQAHALAWQALMSIALSRPVDLTKDLIEIRTTRGDLLRALGIQPNAPKAKAQICKHLEEIMCGNIKLSSPRHSFSASLIATLEIEKRGDKDGLPKFLTAKVPKEVFALLCDEIVAIPLQQKRALGKDAVTLWLHDFLSSQSNDPTRMIPWPIEALYKLCGSQSTLRAFRSAVKKAAARLAVGPGPLLLKWSIDKDDRLVYTKRKTRVVLLPPPAKKVEQIHSYHNNSVAVAQAQRARVLL